MAEQRPSPEKLLQRIQEEERHQLRGKLKIYLGAAPGVGKTYSMLHDALARRAQGLDVVVGVVETHGRKELNDFLKGLEILPRQAIEYRGQKLTEFDLDAALLRNPALILMDELAHTNAPNLRHEKRWQDVKELLDRGIDVYTTLNVQHIESLNDVISQIIHTTVKETVPDFMLEIADTIELVDLPPEELLKRLQDGKVYIPQQAELAAENFFRKGNLIALRELALRITANRVNAQVLLYRQGEGIKHVWPTKEKLLVCVGSRTQSTDIIRAARRMANSLQAEWIAVNVETPGLGMSEETRNRIIMNLRLAEQLGAETKILMGVDIVEEIIRFAREENVTTIIVGKRIRSRWKNLFSTTLSDELVRYSGEIDVYIITGLSEDTKQKYVKPVQTDRAISWAVYAATIGVVALVTIVDFFLFPYVKASTLVMMYLLGVTLVALFGRNIPSILASILSVLAYDYFFVPPYYGLRIGNYQYLFTLLIMLLVMLIIGHFAVLSRRQTEAARLAEQHTATLHRLSRQLASTRGVDKLLDVAVQHVEKVFDSEAFALMPDGRHLKIRGAIHAQYNLNAKELGVAQWVFDLGQMAGLGTDTLPFSEAIYVPLRASQETIGVLRVRPKQKKRLLTPEQMHLLEACANQIALAIEVDRFQEKTKQSELQTETDRVRNALLQSVSHDLRTPLAAIIGSASTLVEMGKELDRSRIKKIGADIYNESEQLSRLINNLLQMTYLEAESVKLEKELYSLSNIVNLVIDALSKKVASKPIKINIPSDLPKVPLDRILLEEVFINLIDNAIKFTPKDSPIEIFAEVKDDKVLVSVGDKGPGIMPDEVNLLFEKFYRGRMLESERGLGLGLAICRSIIKAHGGEIWAENRADGGAMFHFTLPLHLTDS